MLLQALFFICMPILSDAYGTGAPNSACVTMMPGHSVDAQTTASPYEILVDNSTYSQNGMIEVTVKGTFQGVLVQARRKDSTNTAPVGTFTNPPTNTKLKACTATADSWTHENTNPKTDAKIMWKSPQYTAGDIEFVATVAQVKVTFWTQQKSLTLSPEDDYPSSATSASYAFLTLILSAACTILVSYE